MKTLLGIVILAGIYGIIGNRSDAGMLWAWDIMMKIVPASVPIAREWLLLASIVFLGLVALLVWLVVLYRGTALAKDNYALIEENNRLVNKHGDLLRANSSLKSENNRLYESISVAVAQNEELSIKNSDLRAEMTHVKENNQALSVELTALQQQHNSLIEERTDLTQQLEAQTQASDILKKEILNYESALQRLRNYGVGADLVLKLLAVLTQDAQGVTQSFEESTSKLLRVMLNDIASIFGDQATGVYVLRPHNSSHYLVPWVWRFLEMDPSQTQALVALDDTTQLSTPAQAFISGKLQVEKNSSGMGEGGVASQPQSIPVEHDPRKRAFLSLAAIPVIGPSREKIAVLCVESRQIDTFDSSEIQSVLYDLADRFASAVCISRNLIEASQSPVR